MASRVRRDALPCRRKNGSIAPGASTEPALPLTPRPPLPIPCLSVGWTAAPRTRRKAAGEESPGSMDMRCRIMSGGGDPRESATESKPPPRLRLRRARVKRCGKSAPRGRQRTRHGKPHREQNRIGAARREISGSMSGSAARVGCSRRRATGVPEEWPSRAGLLPAPYRTRLTGRLTRSRGASDGPPSGAPPVYAPAHIAGALRVLYDLISLKQLKG